MLGFRNRGGTANAVARYRVRAAVRSIDPGATDSVLVLCGGGVGDVTEAEMMASYARERLGFTGPILLDTRSATTRENIQNAIPLVEDRDTIKIVSNSLHAARGRALLLSLRPDLAARLVRADEHRFGEIPLIKLIAVVLEGWHRIRGASTERRGSRPG